jgi:adenylate cyclase
MATTSIQLSGRAGRRRWRRARARTPACDGLEREALSAEKLRVRVMLTVIGVGVAFSVVPADYLFGDVGRAFRGDLPTFVRWRFVILAAWALYLLGERVMLGYLNRRGKTLPRFYRYVTALVETSCPTAEIVVAASYTNSSAVATAPYAAYPLFIVLSALRLDFRLCVFTGAVAAVEYTLASLLFVGAQGGGAFDAAPGGAALHAAKGALLLSLGVLAARRETSA